MNWIKREGSRRGISIMWKFGGRTCTTKKRCPYKSNGFTRF
jgi:hypothetical protein